MVVEEDRPSRTLVGSAHGIERKIVIFLAHIEPGGVAQVALSLASEFVRRKYPVAVVAPRVDPEMRQAIPHGVQVVDLGSGRLVRSVPAFARYLRRAKPYAVLSMTDLANVAAVIARRFSGHDFRLAISCHMALSDLPPGARRFVHRILPLLMRLTYRRANVVVAVSETVARQTSKLSGLDRARISVVDNPVNIDRVLRLSTETVTCSWLDSDIPVIVSVGRLVAQKDFPTLVRAFRDVRDDRPARLIILGEGYARPELEALIAELDLQDDVRLPGYVENPYPYMRRSAVFVLPSVTEAFGLVLVEALACGSRIVATDCSDGPRHILAQGEFGEIVPPGEPEPMGRAILHMLGNKADSDRLKERAREISDPARTADIYLSLLGLSAQSDRKPHGGENR